MPRPFNGYKSYLGAALIGIAAALMAAGLIDPMTAAVLKQIGEAVLGAGLAHKLSKVITG